MQGSDTRSRENPVSRGRVGLGGCPDPKAMGFEQTPFEDTALKYNSQPNGRHPVSRSRLAKGCDSGLRFQLCSVATNFPSYFCIRLQGGGE